MRNYCTLFDSKYLPQGLALYDSLLRHSSEPFTLYVLPLDQQCAETLTAMVLPHVVMVAGFHETHPGMKEARANRSYAEYCYTSASCLCEYLMANLDLPHIAYVDSDCWFADNPEIVFDEIGERSLGIIPHRFPAQLRWRESKNGMFNVSLVYFKRDEVGMACLNKWAAQCKERCDINVGCADQCFLDSWPTDYSEACAIIENMAVGVAPWNLQSYRVTAGPCVNGSKICMFHFHETRFNDDGSIKCLTNWPLRVEDKILIYGRYIQAVSAARSRIKDVRGKIDLLRAYESSAFKGMTTA